MPSSEQEAKLIDDTVKMFEKKYKFLDDMNFYLENNQTDVNKAINKYSEDADKIMINMLAIDFTAIVAKESYRQFLRDMVKFYKRFNIKGHPFRISKARRTKLMRELVKQYVEVLGMTANNMTQKTRAKAREFTLAAQNSQIPKAALKNFTDRQITVNMGTSYIKDELKNVWGAMTEKYGRYDTVQFRNGTEYPMRAYIDNRIVTENAEVQRASTRAYAASTNQYTSKISHTNTKDSCIYYDSKIIFNSDLSKKLFQKEFPGVGDNWPTYEQVKNDDTHMFEFGCKHNLSPWPIQYLDKEDFENQVESNVIEQPPKKINENKVKEQIEKGKFEKAA